MPETLLFRHEAMLYEGAEAFVAGAAPFIRAAVTEDEPIMVAVGADKLDLLRSHLREEADGGARVPRARGRGPPTPGRTRAAVGHLVRPPPRPGPPCAGTGGADLGRP